MTAITVRFPRNPTDHLGEDLQAERLHRPDGFWWDVTVASLQDVLDRSDAPILVDEAESHREPDYVATVMDGYPRDAARRL